MNNFKKIFSILIVVMLFVGCNSETPVKETGKKNINTVYSARTETITEVVTLEDNKTKAFEISYTYPLITSTKMAENAKKLNIAFEKEAKDYIEKIKTSDYVKKAKKMCQTTIDSKREFYPHSVKVNYILEYNKNNVLSYLKTEDIYVGGTSNICKAEGKTYNLETGKKLELGDVFEVSNLGITKILADGLTKKAEEEKELFNNKTTFTDEEIKAQLKNSSWYLTNEGIEFFFNPNTIVPEVSEILQFNYSFVGNKTMFKLDLETTTNKSK